MLQPPTYRWRTNGTPITDGPTPHGSIISGSTTATLRIDNAALQDAGNYSCIATNGTCGSVTSDAAALTICLADFDCNNSIDFFDYLDFVQAFAAESSRADINRDRTVDFLDYLDFVAAFDAGCP